MLNPTLESRALGNAKSDAHLWTCIHQISSTTHSGYPLLLLAPYVVFVEDSSEMNCHALVQDGRKMGDLAQHTT